MFDDAPPYMQPAVEDRSIPSVLNVSPGQTASDVRQIAVASELERMKYEQMLADRAVAERARQAALIRNIVIGAGLAGLAYWAYRKWA